MGFVFRPISIHAPHTGRDLTQSISRICITQFQSTRPIRGATVPGSTGGRASRYFNPRAPYGARRAMCRLLHKSSGISIHAPHTGRDALTPSSRCCWQNFNPRAPYGARLPRVELFARQSPISIHAPHTGRDGNCDCTLFLGGISIHAPHTGRDLAAAFRISRTF